MTRRLLCGVLVVIFAALVGRETDAADVLPSVDLKTQVFRYLDSPDSDQAARTLQAMLSDPYVTIDQVIGIIQTERDYALQPTGVIPDERIDVHGACLSPGSLRSSNLSADERLWIGGLPAWRGIYR